MTAIIVSFIIITLVNVLAYIWAYKKQSDHLTDISYSLCFFAVTLYFLFTYNKLTLGRIILASMVILWGLRLGGFLFYRIQKMGKDLRFDTFRQSATGFLKFWLLQSISIWVIVLPVLIGLLDESLSVNVYACFFWFAGWILQSIADWQKFIFKSNNSKDAFIQTGVFANVRHPNYTGEIIVWLTIFWYIMPALHGWQWLSIISPIWIVLLLVGISGIPLIEKANKNKYNTDLIYKNYVDNTWRLIPYIY